MSLPPDFDAAQHRNAISEVSESFWDTMRRDRDITQDAVAAVLGGCDGAQHCSTNSWHMSHQLGWLLDRHRAALQQLLANNLACNSAGLIA